MKNKFENNDIEIMNRLLGKINPGSILFKLPSNNFSKTIEFQKCSIYKNKKIINIYWDNPKPPYLHFNPINLHIISDNNINFIVIKTRYIKGMDFVNQYDKNEYIYIFDKKILMIK